VPSPLCGPQWQTGDNAERRQAVGRLSKQVVLSNVHVFRLLDDPSLLQVITQLPAFLHTHPEVSLITYPTLYTPGGESPYTPTSFTTHREVSPCTYPELSLSIPRLSPPLSVRHHMNHLPLRRQRQLA
jgi:hypothetical protein